MNYYERYSGDYLRDTKHLSLAEHGAYTLLLDTYYSTEKPLQKDKQSLYRICSAISAAERKAVDSVLAQFFRPDDEGFLRNSRADADIAEAQPRIAAAKANGKLGGRPKKQQKTETQEKPNGFANGNPTETREQSSPHTTHQAPVKTNNVGHTHTKDDDVCVSPGEVCLAMREAGLADTNPGHVTLIELVNAGATIDEFVGATNDAKTKGKGFAYAIGIVKKRREEVANLILHQGQLPETAKPKPSGPPWWSNDATIIAKGKELGLNPRPGELMPEFKGRINIEIERRSKSADDG